MLYELSLNDLIPLFTVGGLFLVAIYHTNLYIFNRSKFLRSYAIYLWCCFAFVFQACFTMSKIITESHPLAFLLVSATLWQSFNIYLRFLFDTLNSDTLYKSFAFRIVKYFWLSIPIDISVHLLKLILPVGYYSLLNTFSTLMNLTAVISCIYVWYIIYIYYQQSKGRIDIRYFKYIVIGSLIIILSNILSIATQFTSNKIFLFSQLSYISIGYFIEVIFFSLAISFKMKIDSKQKYLALSKVIEQDHLIKSERTKAIEFLLEQDLKVQNELTKSVINQRFIFGRKLHDDLLGSLLALKYLVNDTKSENQATPRKTKFDLIEKEIDYIYTETRNYSHRLINSNGIEENYRFDIKAYLDKLKSQFLQINLIKVFFTIDETGLSLLDNFKINYLYYLIKECFSNALKHSKSQNIWISISFENNICTLVFSDDGCGYKNKASQGQGIIGMKEKVKYLNGSFKIGENSKKEKLNVGTEINIQFPI